jgi:hypothetical protein
MLLCDIKNGITLFREGIQILNRYIYAKKNVLLLLFPTANLVKNIQRYYEIYSVCLPAFSNIVVEFS